MDTENQLDSPFPHQIHTLDEESVHHLRKGTKKLRARLQLHRNLEGIQQENEELRCEVKQLAWKLAAHRDNDVTLALLDELIASITPSDVQALLITLRARLRTEPLPEQDLPSIRKLVSKISKQSQRLDNPPFTATDIDRYLADKLQSLVTEGRALLRSTDWEALHNWRKQVKKLLYQFELKQAPSAADVRMIETLDALGGCLGRINDFCLLERYVHTQQPAYTRAHDLLAFQQVFKLIDQRREVILAQCRDLFAALDTATPAQN